VRAMILGAGLGARMRPLSNLVAKPALPILGLPVVATLLELLGHHGVNEVLINTHHLGESIKEAVSRFAPPDLDVSWSEEPRLLGTGGGIRRAADFLKKTETSLVLAGDMLLDLDLSAAVQRHRDRGCRVSLLLRRDARLARFGTIGIDRGNVVRRVGQRADLGDEVDAGVFLSARILSRQAFDDLPESEVFEDLSDWFLPRLQAGHRDIEGQILETAECVWEPVGTPQEYLRTNLQPPELSYLAPSEMLRRSGTRTVGDVVVGSGSRVPVTAQLERCVVWENESVPENLKAVDGVFACGTFYPSSPNAKK